MKRTKANGCTSFNFGRVEGSLDDGLFTFKSSFDPEIDVFIGEFILSCKWSNIFEKISRLFVKSENTN